MKKRVIPGNRGAALVICSLMNILVFCPMFCTSEIASVAQRMS
jgi:hypothetical protein